MTFLSRKIGSFLLLAAFFLNSLPVFAIEPAPPVPSSIFADESDTESLRRRGFGQDGRRQSLSLAVPNDPYYSSKGSLFSGFPLLDDLWGLKLLDVERAWEFTRGSGITVAVIDTGVYLDHADLRNNIWVNLAETNGIAGFDDDGNGYVDDVNGWDFVDGDSDPSDLNGHGTHVAGIIGALAGNNIGIAGVAPESRIMAIRVLDEFGGGYFEDVADGIRYAADMGARVINLSLGASIFEVLANELADLLDAVAYATDLGAVVVAAAGNSNGNIAYQVPARFDQVISVGALRHQYDVYYGTGPLSRARFSEKGIQLDFMAPGVDILSLAVDSSTYAGYDSFHRDGYYYSASDGTSMAAPMVSGTIALLLARNPLLTFQDIYRQLRYSSADMGAVGFDTRYGYGRVNAYEALSHEYYENGAVKNIFYPNGRLQEFGLLGKLTKDISPDDDIRLYYASGNIQQYFEASTRNTYDYLDENFYGAHADGHGQGRLAKTTKPNGDIIAIDGYWPGTDQVKSESRYVSGVLQKLLEYDASGQFLQETEFSESGAISKITYASGNYSEYYPSGRKKSDFTQSTGLYVEYYDEDLGRKLKEIHQDGTEFRYLEYWGDTSSVKVKAFYQTGVFLKTVEYGADGVFIRKVSLANGDAYEYYFPSNNIKSTLIAGVLSVFLNENFYGRDEEGHGRGRLSATIENGLERRYKEYYQGTDTAKTVETYADGGLISTRTYDRAGRLLKDVYPDGYETYTYNSSGKLTRNVVYAKSGSSYVIDLDYTYTYHARFVSGRVVDNDYALNDSGTLKLLSTNEFTFAAPYPFEPGNFGSLKTQKSVYYLYNEHGSRFVESTRLSAFYYDLDRPGEETLKTDDITMYELNAAGTSSRKVYSLDAEYEMDGATVKWSEEKMWMYHDNGRVSRYEINTVRDNKLTQRKIYTYDTRGRVLEIQTFTYYASGNLKSENLDKARVTYVYKDENFDGEGKGRLIKKINPNGTYETYEYYGGTADLSYIRYHRSNGTVYRVDHFGRSLPEEEAAASALELSAFGGSGFFEMQGQKISQRSTSSAIPVDAEKALINPLS